MAQAELQFYRYLQIMVQWSKRLLGLLVALFLLFLLLDAYKPLPVHAFSERNFAQVVVDKNGQPLRAFADNQGVWRYPVKLEEVSPLYIDALLNYEDRYFYQHFGVNPLAFIRALGQRLRYGRFVSGGSTITMQVARIMQPHEKSFTGKLQQMFRALQLEWHYNKSEILTFYLNYAPFGGPIEGVQAASYTYLQKPVSDVTYSEAALLAVLPQAPSRLRPDRHIEKAKAARNKVLARLDTFKVWPAALIEEAKNEEIWAGFNARPMVAPLLTRRLSNQYPQKNLIESTIEAGLQRQLETMLKDHAATLDAKVSSAILVIDNSNLAVRAYLGSADFMSENRKGHVDMIRATRSPGSTLKPFIYAMAIDQGLIHSQSLLFDVPHSFDGYRPENFTQDFSGPVSVSQALVRSLNMPAVQVLEKLNPQSFYVNLKNAGLTIQLPEKAKPNLSLALGGGGVSMQDLASVFSAFGRKGIAGKLSFTASELLSNSHANNYPLVSEGAAWIVQNMLSKASLNTQLNSRHLAPGKRIAFKTGTSYGHRDAWVLASNRDYTIAVWVGQPDGSFLTNNTGRNSAVPILNKVLAILPNSPVQHSQPLNVHHASICWPLGYKQDVQSESDCHVKKNALLLDHVAPPTLIDPMRKSFSSSRLPILINRQTGERVTPECSTSDSEIKEVVVWPLVLEKWLDRSYSRTVLLPPLSPSCVSYQSNNMIKINGIHDNSVVYPEVNSFATPSIELSVEGSMGENYWFLDGVLLEQTSADIVLHELEPGKHHVLVMDSTGNQSELNFFIGANDLQKMAFKHSH